MRSRQKVAQDRRPSALQRDCLISEVLQSIRDDAGWHTMKVPAGEVGMGTSMVPSWTCQLSPGLKATATDYLNFETRSANSSMTLAASAAAVPVGSPLYVILGLER